MTNKIAKRSIKESTATRELAYTELSAVALTNHVFVGRTDEGLIFKGENGLSILVKVVAKGIDFSAENAVEGYGLELEIKAKALALAESRKSGKVKVVKPAKGEGEPIAE